ncbi:MAG: hypothetical protein AAGD32_08425 [Planctomycetota bacterium]
MYRTFVIARHTAVEAIAQPIYLLLLAVGAALMGIFGLLPFFTLGEDTKMFLDVGRDFVLLLVLIATLFATSATVFNEIENRTMLTLMSKPVGRLEVLLGKYLGLLASALLAVVALGLVLGLATWLRVPTDYTLNPETVDGEEAARLFDTRMMHLTGLAVSLLMAWMQIGVLAAISVAISTRVSLVVNLPVLFLLYLAGNLARFLDVLGGEANVLVRGIAQVVNTLLPFLAVFDLRELTLYAPIALPGSVFAADPGATSVGTLTAEVGLSSLYFVLYVTAALTTGLLLFRGRELGGGE